MLPVTNSSDCDKQEHLVTHATFAVLTVLLTIQKQQFPFTKCILGRKRKSCFQETAEQTVIGDKEELQL